MLNLSTMAASSTVHFEGVDGIDSQNLDELENSHGGGASTRPSRGVVFQDQSNRSLMSAPGAPPEQHRRGSLLQPTPAEQAAAARLSVDDDYYGSVSAPPSSSRGRRHRFTLTFGGVSKRTAYREIRRARKTEIKERRGWENYNPTSSRTMGSVVSGFTNSNQSTDLATISSIGEIPTDEELERNISSMGEGTPLKVSPLKSGHGYGGSIRDSCPERLHMSSMSISETDNRKQHMEALIEMFTENKINLLLGFLPLAVWSHYANWSAGSVFILNFIAMVPLASMLGVFTEELAAHTNDVIGGLINATFGNAVELVVAIQALLANDFRVVQASLIGSVFSNLLLVLGMCFFCGGIRYTEQEFIAQGAVASIALLAFSGLTLLMPEFFGEGGGDTTEVDGGGGRDVELTVSRIGAMLLILMYLQLLFFQLKTHVHLFEGDDDVVALIPFKWALIGLVLITAIVTVLSEFLVGSIDGFCEEFNIGKSFVGVIILPVVGNAVEHISAVSVAMKNKMDLALGGMFLCVHCYITLMLKPLFSPRHI